jgi:hypothetical protein
MTGGRPVDEPTRSGLEGTTSGSSLFGSWGLGVDAGEGLATGSSSLPVDPLLELEGDDGGGITSAGAEDPGTGDARWFPVPGRGSLWSGTGVTIIS